MSFKHRCHCRIDVTPVASSDAETPNPVESNATEDNYRREFKNLSPSTTYKIRVSSEIEKAEFFEYGPDISTLDHRQRSIWHELLLSY